MERGGGEKRRKGRKKEGNQEIIGRKEKGGIEVGRNWGKALREEEREATEEEKKRCGIHGKE